MLSDQSPILVTGGAGFIGSHFVLDWFSTVGTPLVNLDKLTYAGNLRNLLPIADRTGYHFVRGDIQDRALIDKLLADFSPRAIVHLAAESHVDRSLVGPASNARPLPARSGAKQCPVSSLWRGRPASLGAARD